MYSWTKQAFWQQLLRQGGGGRPPGSSPEDLLLLQTCQSRCLHFTDVSWLLPFQAFARLFHCLHPYIKSRCLLPLNYLILKRVYKLSKILEIKTLKNYGISLSRFFFFFLIISFVYLILGTYKIFLLKPLLGISKFQTTLGILEN